MPKWKCSWPLMSVAGWTHCSSSCCKTMSARSHPDSHRPGMFRRFPRQARQHPPARGMQRWQRAYCGGPLWSQLQFGYLKQGKAGGKDPWGSDSVSLSPCFWIWAKFLFAFLHCTKSVLFMWTCCFLYGALHCKSYFTYDFWIISLSDRKWLH